MEEDIKLLKEMQNNCIKSMMKGAIYTDEKAERKSLAIENILNELERLHTENTNITRELLARTDKLNDSIPKQVIRDKIEFYKRYGKVQNSDEYVMSVEIFVLEEILGEEK